MDDALALTLITTTIKVNDVLILVVMDDALAQIKSGIHTTRFSGS